SILQRMWNAVKPPPSVHKRKPLSATQKLMIRIPAGILALAAIGYGIYYWINSAPDRAEAHFQTGMRSMSPGKYPGAISEFTTAVGIWDRHAQAYLQRGIARQILGQQDAALEDFERAAQVDPSLAEAFTARGTILRDRGDLQGAIREITRSLSVRGTM